MRWILLCGIFLGLSGCGHTQVHLYAKYLSASEVNRISEQLKKDDFDVDVNQLTFPISIRRNSLVYSLMLPEQSELTRLTQSTAKLGYSVESEVPLFSNNHSFTRDSIGLFLIPEGLDVAALMSYEGLVGRYYSKACDVEVQLLLNLDKTYTLVRALQENSDANTFDNKQETLLSGFWKVTQYPYVQLSGPKSHPWVASFEAQVQDEIEFGVAVENTYLKPLNDYERFHLCQFYKGRVP
ncbi:putative lipoprotein [Glaciecola sp. 4H-3-7+YE-5]|nr:putative lipoprotein [Glaciecola sp. 4H-3-7+YE-5]